MTKTITNDTPAAGTGAQTLCGSDQRRTVYLSGPMTGYPEWNYPAFHAAAARLRSLGWEVISPADSKLPPDTTPRADFIRDDLTILCQHGRDGGPVDGIVFLDGWEQSRGARLEALVGLEMAMLFFLYSPNVCEEVVPIPPHAVRWQVSLAIFDENETAVGISTVTVDQPTTTLPQDKDARKGIPLTTGMLDYFPAALAEVARVSKAGNDQHNPGQPLHHARGKSMDHADCIARHLMERGTIDDDGMRHTAKAAWRILAALQEELEAAGAPLARGARLPALAKEAA